MHRDVESRVNGVWRWAWRCSGAVLEPEMVSVNVQPQQPFVQSGQPEPLKIVIEPFEDLRGDRSKIGQRTHLGGGVTNFNVSGGSPGVTVAEALAEALRWRGWNRRVGMPASCSRASRCQARIL